MRHSVEAWRPVDFGKRELGLWALAALMSWWVPSLTQAALDWSASDMEQIEAFENADNLMVENVALLWQEDWDFFKQWFSKKFNEERTRLGNISESELWVAVVKMIQKELSFPQNGKMDIPFVRALYVEIYTHNPGSLWVFQLQRIWRIVSWEGI